MAARKKSTAQAGSAASAVDAFQNAFAGDIQPPESVKLREVDAPIWVAVVRARAREEWNDVDLHHAANLTRCLADVERISTELQDEGDCLSNDRGTRIVNPKHALLEVLSRRAVALTRLLSIHAAALADPRKQVPQRQTEAAARAAKEALSQPMPSEDDDLLARPSVRH